METLERECGGHGNGFTQKPSLEGWKLREKNQDYLDALAQKPSLEGWKRLFAWVLSL